VKLRFKITATKPIKEYLLAGILIYLKELDYIPY